MRMQIIHKIKAIKRIYGQADRHVAEFMGRSGLRCIPGCGTCCMKPDIQTTVLEFLPAAWSLYQRGEHLGLIEKIDQHTDRVCVFYNPFLREGFCSVYGDRGLLCRLFGFSCRKDKYGNRIIVTCGNIKNSIGHPGLEEIIACAPEMANYYWKLYAIDPTLSVQYYPINQAVRKAIDLVVCDIQYRKRPA